MSPRSITSVQLLDCSSNGTYVNGKAVGKSKLHILASGDTGGDAWCAGAPRARTLVAPRFAPVVAHLCAAGGGPELPPRA